MLSQIQKEKEQKSAQKLPQPPLPQAPAPRPVLAAQASEFIDEGMLTELIGGLKVAVKSPEQSALELYCTRLRIVMKLSELDGNNMSVDPRVKLSEKGLNVLHLVAAQPDFAPYKAIVEKFLRDPQFPKLITQSTHAGGLTCMHAIAKHGNVAMLKCLLSTKNEDMRDYLRFSGTALTIAQKNVFNFLGEGHGNPHASGVTRYFIENNVNGVFPRKHVHTQAIPETFFELFDLLVALYGRNEARSLAAQASSNGCTILTHACLTGNDRFVEKVLTLFVKNIEHKEDAGYVKEAYYSRHLLLHKAGISQVTPFDIACAVGKPECVELLIAFNKAHARIACRTPNKHFSTHSGLEMALVTSSESDAERFDLMRVCHLILNHLAIDESPQPHIPSEQQQLEAFLAHKSSEAQEVLRLVQVCTREGIGRLKLEDNVLALRTSYEQEKAHL